MARRGYRTCARCGANRATRFFTPRGRICQSCRRDTTRQTARRQHLQETYDITLEEYDAILKRQGGRCAICGRKPAYNLHVDHDHALERAVGVRGSVRGLLCKTCNKRLLPAARDDEQTLLAAIDYLRFPPAADTLRGTQGA
jgi:hypothetical protein